jgi:hypothetical protein
MRGQTMNNQETNEIEDGVKTLLEKFERFQQSLTECERNHLHALMPSLQTQPGTQMGEKQSLPVELVRLGSITVDSGYIVVCDPGNLEVAQEEFDADLKNGSIQLYRSFRNEWADLGVFFQPGFGDGGYPVYGQLVTEPANPTRRRIRSIFIEFF